MWKSFPSLHCMFHFFLIFMTFHCGAIVEGIPKTRRWRIIPTCEACNFCSDCKGPHHWLDCWAPQNRHVARCNACQLVSHPRYGGCCWASPHRAVQISRSAHLDSLDLKRAMGDCDLYVLEFNLSHFCWDEQPDRLFYTLYRELLGSIPEKQLIVLLAWYKIDLIVLFTKKINLIFQVWDFGEKVQGYIWTCGRSNLRRHCGHEKAQ